MAVPGEDRPDVGGQVSGPQTEGTTSEEEEDEGENVEPSFFSDPKRLIQTGVIVVLLIAGIYLLLPSIVGLDDAVKRLQRADWIWIAVALAFNVLAFGSYVALFRGVVGENVLKLTWSESYQITMAGLAATRLFSAGGAGGIVLTYWALRKAGMPRRQSACRMVAFLVLLYAVYMLTVIINGILLRTGVFNGPNPGGLTIVPAAIAGVVIALFLLIALLPEDFERRMRSYSRGYRRSRLVQRLASVPASMASGVRTAIDFVRQPVARRPGRRGGDRLLGGEHRDPVGQLPRLRRRGPPRRGGPGVLRRDGRQPDPVRPGRGGGGRRRPDRHLRPLRPAGQRGLRRRPRLPVDRVLAADPARDRGVLPAAANGRALAGGPGAPGGRERPGRVASGVDLDLSAVHYFRK